MKDSQLQTSLQIIANKYIKESNERFSTGKRSQARKT